VNLEEFQGLPAARIARALAEAGTEVCAFPTNGTRRWLFLEHPPRRAEDFADAYLNQSQAAHLDLYRMIYDHGLHTLISPIFGPDLVARGDQYMSFISEGLARVAEHPGFLSFYDEYEVGVRFYGDYRRHFAGTPYAHLCDLFETVMQRTAHHTRTRLFYGLFAHDPTEQLAALSIDHYLRHGAAPTRDDLIAAYYGEPVPPVDLFIGFDKLAVFDVPLLLTGSEDLYFTVSPSPYLTAAGLRRILYDHLYARCDTEPDYATLPPAARDEMRAFYRANRESVLGVGTKHPHWGCWVPLPEVRTASGSKPRANA
jgi:tuberculosinol/isotuberculosinol synthase